MTLAQSYKKQFGKVSYPFRIYDSKGKEVYYEDSDDYWWKREYDSNGNETYFEDSNDYWEKREYGANGKLTYFEDSDDYWWKYEYDSNGNEIYAEDSDGVKRDKRKSSCEGKVVEIDGKKYELKEL